jgi:hypothetical protein
MPMQSSCTKALLAGLIMASLVIGCSRQASETPRPHSAGVRVTDVTLGRSLNADKTVLDKTERFSPSDVIYAAVVTEGSAASASLQATWTYQDGQVVNQSTQSIVPTDRTTTEFHISKPDGWPTGRYRLEISLNGAPAQTKEFEVAM